MLDKIKTFFKEWWVLIVVILVLVLIVTIGVHYARPKKLDSKKYDKKVDSLNYLAKFEENKKLRALLKADSLQKQANFEKLKRDCVIVIHDRIEEKLKVMPAGESVDQLKKYLDEEVSTGN